MSNQLTRDKPIPTVEETWCNLSLIEALHFSAGPNLLRLNSPASTFQTPSLTASDEEEIELLEQQAAKSDITYRLPRIDTVDSEHSPSFWQALDESEHLSRLGESTNLFSPNTSIEKSPGTFLQVKEARLEPQRSLFKSDYPFEISGAPGNKPKVRQTRSKMVVEREPPKSGTLSPKKQNQPAFDRENSEKEMGKPLTLSFKNPNLPSIEKSQGLDVAKPTNRPNQPPLEKMQHPEFGQASPLQNRLQSSVFNIPKRQQPRAEHHRPAPSGGKDHVLAYGDPYQPRELIQPKHDAKILRTADCFEIPRPTNHPTWSSHRAAQATFSSFVPATVDTSSRVGNFIDLTSSVNQFNPDNAIFDDRFGAADPYNYIDVGKATDNIKALLEGAFDDEEDKPKTRARKKKAEATTSGITDSLQSLGVDKEQNGQGQDEEEEEEDEDDGTFEGLGIKLLPHQVEGVEWMRDKEVGLKKKNGILPKGGILADDMGLGKTIQSISLILTNPRNFLSPNADNKKTLPKSVEKGTLVVAPLALIKQWEAEIKNRVLDSHRLRVCVHHGPQRTKRSEDLRKYDVVITTYQILVSEHGSSGKADGPQVGCFGLHWYRVILDEAHSIKNRLAKATKACCALRAEYRWCLTGTPMQNNLDELQSLINFLRIKPYNELAVWKDQITRPMANGRGGVAIKRLQFYLKAFMKRRTKDVLRLEGALNAGGKKTGEGGLGNGFKITGRRVENISAEFSAAERKFYDRLEKRADKSLEKMMGGQKISYASALVLLLRLRQACNHPQLVGGSMAQDNDALTIGQAVGSQTPRKPKVVDKDMDDMAGLLGGLTVQAKQCDVCQTELQRDEVAAGSVRCIDCEEDLAEQLKSTKSERVQNRKRQTSSGVEAKKLKVGKRPHRRTIIDSSDEEESKGDWLVPERQRISQDLGKAGGTDDENAEGDGESLGAEDSDTEDEDVVLPSRQRKKTVSLGSSNNDVEDASGSSEGESTPESEEEEESVLSSREPTPTDSAKINHLIKILQRESAQHKFIVFSQFTSMLNLIEPFLKKNRLIFTRYDGSMRNDHREASLERLRTDPKTRVLLCSLKCGSLGLNLTAASRVVILEPFWNPFVEEQAIDRVHRLNQTVDVTVYKLTVANTVEERILALQDKKRALAEAAIEGKAVGKLSMQDILNLFRRDAEAYDHGDVGLGEKPRVLSPIEDEPRGGSSVGVRAGGGLRVSPPVMEKGRAPVREEDAWSRRW